MGILYALYLTKEKFYLLLRSFVCYVKILLTLDLSFHTKPSDNIFITCEACLAKSALAQIITLMPLFMGNTASISHYYGLFFLHKVHVNWLLVV